MFGLEPRHGDQTGIQPDQFRSNKPQDNTQFILDKIKELDERLTKQMTCDHGPFEYKFVGSFVVTSYRKACKMCGLVMGEVTHKQRLEEQLSFHEAEASRLREALHKNFSDKEDNQ